MIALTLPLSALLLALEGFFLSSLVLRVSGQRTLRVALGLPLGALCNVFVFVVLNLLSVEWTALSVYGLHLLVLLVLALASWRQPNTGSIEPVRTVTLPRWLEIVSILSLLLVLLPAALHALTIPSIGWDSFTNWAARAKLSLEAGRFIAAGVVQPQYPVLYHSLLMLPMLPDHWNDQATKVISLLLDGSAAVALWSLVRLHVGRRAAFLVLAVLAAVPLVALHLRQGYADLHWALFALLAAASMQLSFVTGKKTLLVLSALCIAAAACTKLEGLYVGLLPWLVALGIHGLRTNTLKASATPALLACALSAVWPAITLLRGELPTVHAVFFQYHPEAVGRIVEHLFLLGSFGVFWWLIVALLLLCLFHAPLRTHLQNTWLQFALLSTAGVLAGYLFTPEVRGLLQGDNFARAMLTPTLLCTSALTMLLLEAFSSPSRRATGV